MLSFYSTAIVLYRYRWLLYELVLRDLKLRYRGSVFGFAWTFLNPLLFMAVYTLVFSIFLRIQIHDFPLYLLSGLVPWYWILGAVQQAITAIPDGRMYVGKTLLPTELLIVVPVLSNGVNFLLSLLLVFLLALVLGAHLGWSLLLLPVLIAVELLMILGLSLLTAAINVFYRDLQQLVGYALTAIFFLTPIFYQATNVPQRYQFMVKLSPIAALISSYHDVLYYGRAPSAAAMCFAAIFAIFVLGVALGYFNRYRESFGEYV